jgi:predicted SAM-dependent methyltransferase
MLRSEGWEALCIAVTDRAHAAAISTLRDLLRRRRLREFRRAMQAFPRPYRLHLGCGQIRFEGWVNVDLSTGNDATDVVWDVTDPLPVEDCACRLIYSEHLVEHLTVEDARRLLVECHRALAPGGILRLAMPSLERLVEQYGSGRWREQPWLSQPENRHVSTPCEMLNVAFRSWGHEWLYDAEELHRRLSEAGFTDIRDMDSGFSEVPDLANRERRPDSLLVCEARR